MEHAPASAALGFQHPIRLHITDDLRRTRLTAFFRLLLAIPHFVWVCLLAIVAIFAAVASWFATLVRGSSPLGLHTFLAGYLRYSTHVSAYTFLIADPYPGFYLINMKPEYPIDLEVDPPVEQNRWTVAFRILLAIPALFVANILRNLSQLLAVFSWVLAVLTGRVPEGIRNFAALALRYESQTYGYVLLLSPRYPSFDVGITA
jgi:Domain of unknown function (DUF4389)